MNHRAGGSTFFFMHVMKTAGTSFAQHVRANFPSESLYPDAEPGPRRQEQYWKIEELFALSEQRRAAVRMFHGHFPFVVGELVHADVTLTILRDPVDRTISHLRHCERHFERHRGKPLEAIYEDDWHHPTLFRNYQVKQFALTRDDDPKGHIDVIDVDAERLAIAVANLERVDVLGLTDRYGEFTAEVADRFGWELGQDRRLQVAPGAAEVSSTLRRRIASDSAADLAFYERARELHRERTRR